MEQSEHFQILKRMGRRTTNRMVNGNKSCSDATSRMRILWLNYGHATQLVHQVPNLVKVHHSSRLVHHTAKIHTALNALFIMQHYYASQQRFVICALLFRPQIQGIGIDNFKNYKQTQFFIYNFDCFSFFSHQFQKMMKTFFIT